MASSSTLLLIVSSLLLFSASSFCSAARPHALVLPVTKDAATQQYVIRVRQRTPSVLVKLVVDVGGRYLWVDCDSGYVSSTYRPARCRSAQCSLANSVSCGDCFVSGPRPGCNNNTCGLDPENPFISTSTVGELAEDVLSLPSTDGSNPGPLATDPHFLFSCAPTFLLRGLAKGARGMAGLGRNKVGTPSQLDAAFGFRRKFALCLSSSSSGGVIFFGDGPYTFLGTHTLDASQSLMYTPLLVNPVSTAGTYVQSEKSVEYFIGVKSIRINGKAVPLNRTLLAIDGNGVGGTKISTVTPYTTLETSIYKAVTTAFAAALVQVPTVPPVAPFGLCYDSSRFGSTRVGPGLPQIDLEMQGKSVWRMFGSNTMVLARERVLCLGFVDGGPEPRTSIVIGGYQLEDNLLQFDLAASRLGFSSSLLFMQTTCSNFNFTSSS